MLSKRIIPCLDVTDGRVVKGVHFQDLRDAGDPVQLAKKYDREGADELVFLDITASSDKRRILLDLVERTAACLFIPFTVGGGIDSVETIRDVLGAGADKVSINSAAVKNPNLIHEASSRFGNQCIVVAIDARSISDRTFHSVPDPLPHGLAIDERSRWEVFIHGGRRRTGIDAVKWASYMNQLGAGEILLTSMDKDGTKSGYDLDLTAAVSQQVSIPVIASGGAGTLSHIADVLQVADAALLASMLHFGETTIAEVKAACFSKGLAVRKT